jgi:hypothetical protein
MHISRGSEYARFVGTDDVLHEENRSIR